MADDKKNIPEVDKPAEAPAPTVENSAVPEQLAPEPTLAAALAQIGLAAHDRAAQLLFGAASVFGETVLAEFSHRSQPFRLAHGPARNR